MMTAIKRVLIDLTLLFQILVFCGGILVIIADIGSASYTGIRVINIIGFIFGIMCIVMSLIYIIKTRRSSGPGGR
jgi:hypothetical protein